MLAPSPISWNGVVPRPGRPDPLWDVLSGVLLLIADRGQRIRWRSAASPIGVESHYLVNDTWFEMMPPYSKMQHLVARLLPLIARGWWDWWCLRRIYKQYVRLGAPVLWERSITMNCHEELLSGIIRIECTRTDANVEIDLAQASEKTSAAAGASIADFVKRLPISEMVDAFCG